MSKNHYIPKLCLRPFATIEKINSYNVQTEMFETKKIKNVFCEEDIFTAELEEAFAKKLEGPFGDLLNNKLLADTDTIGINRKENLLIRKFEMVRLLRSTYSNMPYEKLMANAQELDNPMVQMMMRFPEMQRAIPSEKTYMSDLMMLMQYDTIEDILMSKNVSPSLRIAANMALVSYFAVWDTTESGEEYILTKLPGSSLQDQYGTYHKLSVLTKYYEENKMRLSELERLRLEVALCNLSGNVENYWICPLSPTRAIVGISPYFKLFFPEKNASEPGTGIPKLFDEEQFYKHFYERIRMELFEPCKNFINQQYFYKVNQLTAHEVHFQNALALNEEMEEFVFHDYEKIRNSFWAYEKVFTMVKKKHDYSKWI